MFGACSRTALRVQDTYASLPAERAVVPGVPFGVGHGPLLTVGSCAGHDEGPRAGRRAGAKRTCGGMRPVLGPAMLDAAADAGAAVVGELGSLSLPKITGSDQDAGGRSGDGPVRAGAPAAQGSAVVEMVTLYIGRVRGHFRGGCARVRAPNPVLGSVTTCIFRFGAPGGGRRRRGPDCARERVLSGGAARALQRVEHGLDRLQMQPRLIGDRGAGTGDVLAVAGDGVHNVSAQTAMRELQGMGVRVRCAAPRLCRRRTNLHAICAIEGP